MAANESSSQNESVKQSYAEVIPMPRVAASDTEALAIFSKIAKLLLDPGDLKHTFDQFTHHAVELSGAAFGGYFYNENNSWGLLSLVGAPIEAFRRFGQPRITPLFKTTYDGDEIIWSDDITTDARFGQMGGMPGGHVPVRSYLAVPVLKSPGVVHGTLLLGHPQAGRFNEKIASRIADVASMAQVALEREARESEAREARDMLSAITETAPMPIYVKNAKGQITYANPAMVAAVGLPKEEFLGRDVQFYAPEAADATLAIDQRILSGEQVLIIEPVTFTAGDGERRTMLWWAEITTSAVRDERNRFLYAVRVSQDITERRQQEEEERLLMGELNHRVKNTLATIQSLFRQSLRAADSLQGFEESFLGRLYALEATHAVLMKTNWAGGASLADVLRAELAPFHGDKSLRWTGFGPPIVLNTSAAVYLGLILHELTTNAVKYGSLGDSGGQLDVMWHLYEEHDREFLRITWTESGGPAVPEPGKPGFGSKLLASISRQFGGRVSHVYEPTGVVAVIEIPTATIYKTFRDPKAIEKSFAGTE